MRHLDYVQVDHSDQLSGNALLQQTEFSLFESVENIVVAVAVLSQLHKTTEVSVDLVRSHDVGCLWHQIDPLIDD